MSTKTTNLNLDKPEIGDTVSTTITQLGSNFDIIDESLAQIATQVKPSGSDDTTAIQNAINSISSTGGDVLLNGTYTVSNTITILPKVRLVLRSGSVIKPSGDFHVVRLKVDARITGGEIDCSALSTFTHGLIYIDGSDKFGTVGHNTSIIGMKLTSNNQHGYGIFMYASGNWSQIVWVHGYDLVFNNFNKAIFLQCINANDGTQQWINGNQFSKLGFNGNAYDIYLDGYLTVPNETSGNFFMDVQSQPASNTQYFYLSGNMNRVQGMMWDSQLITSGTKATLSANSQYSIIDSSLNMSTGEILDQGKGNHINSNYGNNGLQNLYNSDSAGNTIGSVQTTTGIQALSNYQIIAPITCKSGDQFVFDNSVNNEWLGQHSRVYFYDNTNTMIANTDILADGFINFTVPVNANIVSFRVNIRNVDASTAKFVNVANFILSQI